MRSRWTTDDFNGSAVLVCVCGGHSTLGLRRGLAVVNWIAELAESIHTHKFGTPIHKHAMERDTKSTPSATFGFARISYGVVVRMRMLEVCRKAINRSIVLELFVSVGGKETVK